MDLRNDRGQTMVEYILLLAVSISLVMTFFRSEAFRRMFGEEGRLGTLIKTEAEYSYRHAYIRGNVGNIPADNRRGSAHPSYFGPETNDTRFFGAKEPYPQ
jgi:phosphoribulokinase